VDDAVNRLVLNSAAVAALGADPMMTFPVGQTAAALAELARGFAPVVTGHYRDSLTSTDPEVSGTTMAAQVGTDGEPGAVAIEFGSINNQPFAPITKAVRASGLRLARSSK